MKEVCLQSFTKWLLSRLRTLYAQSSRITLDPFVLPRLLHEVGRVFMFLSKRTVGSITRVSLIINNCIIVAFSSRKKTYQGSNYSHYNRKNWGLRLSAVHFHDHSY